MSAQICENRSIEMGDDRTGAKETRGVLVKATVEASERKARTSEDEKSGLMSRRKVSMEVRQSEVYALERNDTTLTMIVTR